jgi:hypothetical protein
MDKAQLAAEAQRIKENEAFQAALDAMRRDAVEGLVRTPATDIEAIRDHQARARVVDELRGNLEAFIRQGAPRKATGIV